MRGIFPQFIRLVTGHWFQLLGVYQSKLAKHEKPAHQTSPDGPWVRTRNLAITLR